MRSGRNRQTHGGKVEARRKAEAEISTPVHPRVWRLRWPRLGAIELFTAILAIATTVQVWAFIQTERASVAPTAIQLIPEHLGPGPLKIRVQLNNAGKDTAVLERADGGYTIDVRLAKTPNYGHFPKTSKALLLPAQTILVNASPTEPGGQAVVITEQQVTAIKTGEISLWIYGMIVYRDSFSALFGAQSVGYCFKYDPQNPGMYDACADDAYTYKR